MKTVKCCITHFCTAMKKHLIRGEKKIKKTVYFGSQFWKIRSTVTWPRAFNRISWLHKRVAGADRSHVAWGSQGPS